MASASSVERRALEQMIPTWTAQGYRVIKEPMIAELPDFLGSFRPDAIAVGREPCLVIKVINPSAPATKTKINQLQSLFRDRKDWKLEVVYIASELGTIDKTSHADILKGLDEVRSVAELSPKAALLYAWGVFEAVGRILFPESLERGLSPQSLIDLLISQGAVAQEDGDMLRRFGNMRNHIAHGQFALDVAPSEVMQLVGLIKAITLPNQ